MVHFLKVLSKCSVRKLQNPFVSLTLDVMGHLDVVVWSRSQGAHEECSSQFLPNAEIVIIFGRFLMAQKAGRREL